MGRPKLMPDRERDVGSDELNAYISARPSLSVRRLACQCSEMLGNSQDRQLRNFLEKQGGVSPKLGRALYELTELEWFCRFKDVPLEKAVPKPRIDNDPDIARYAESFDETIALMEELKTLPEGSRKREKIRKQIQEKSALLLVLLIEAQFPLPSQLKEFLPLEEMAAFARSVGKGKKKKPL